MNALEIVVKAVDQASSVLDRIGEAGRTAGEKLSENWEKIGVASAAAGAAIEGYARSQQDNTVAAQQLAASLGISEEAARQMAISVAGTGDPLDEMLQLLTLGREQGLSSGEALEEYAGFWDTVADATGLAGPELAKAGVALRGLGIAAGEEEKALGAFGYITRETSGDVGEFLNFISRTSPDLKAMGLGVDETAGLLGAMEKELGLSGRAARTQFNEAIIASKGDLGLMLETLGLTEEQLQEYTAAVKDSSGVIDENAEIANAAFTPLQHLQHQAQELAFRFGGLAQQAATVVPALMAMGPAIKAVSMAKQGWAVATRLVGTAMTFLAANPIVLVIAAIAALALGLVILYRESETFRNIVNAAFGAVRDVAMAVFGEILALVQWAWPAILAVIETVVATIGPIVQNWLNNLLAVWNEFWPLLSAVIELVWSGIQLYIETYLMVIQTVIQTALAVIQAVWDVFWPLLQVVVEVAWLAISTYVTTYITIIRTAIEVGLAAIQAIWSAIWPVLLTIIQPIWDAIRLMVETTLGIITALVTGQLGAVRQVWESGWSAIRDFVGPIWESIRSTVETVFNSIRGTIESILSGVQSTWDSVWSAVRSATETAWAGIQSVVETTFAAIQGGIETTLGAIQSAWETVWGAVRGTTETIWGEISRLVETAIGTVKTTLDTVMGQISGAWDTAWGVVKAGVDAVWNGANGILRVVDGGISSVKTIIDGVMGQLEGAWSGAWGRISSTVSAIWGQITGFVFSGVNSVVDAVNRFLSAFNAITISVPGIDFPSAVNATGVPDIPGFTVGMPNVPLLPRLATGGLLAADMPFFGHKGEHVINPADSRNIDSLARALGLALDRTGGTGTNGLTVPVQFLGPVTIQATNRHDAERAAGDIAFGVVAQLRRRGVR